MPLGQYYNLIDATEIETELLMRNYAKSPSIPPTSVPPAEIAPEVTPPAGGLQAFFSNPIVIVLIAGVLLTGLGD